jgi:hypothetical protein
LRRNLVRNITRTDELMLLSLNLLFLVEYGAFSEKIISRWLGIFLKNEGAV